MLIEVDDADHDGDEGLLATMMMVIGNRFAGRDGQDCGAGAKRAQAGDLPCVRPFVALPRHESLSYSRAIA